MSTITRPTKTTTKRPLRSVGAKRKSNPHPTQTSATTGPVTDRQGQRIAHASPDRRYVLTIEEIGEVIAIVDDLAGEADEEILADALESLYQPVEYTDTVKAQARSGSVAVFRLECAERLELRRLIDTYNYTTTPAMRTRLSRLLHESQKRALAA